MKDKSPSRKVGELDNRGSHFYLATYWAEALAEQDEDTALKNVFLDVSEEMKSKEAAIINELNAVQGEEMNLNGYYFPDTEKASAAMRPSTTLNAILKTIGK